jgi:hypothetical protein
MPDVLEPILTDFEKLHKGVCANHLQIIAWGTLTCQLTLLLSKLLTHFPPAAYSKASLPNWSDSSND